MSKLSDKQCEVCLRRKIRNKARTLCDECREFYCKECSDSHLLYKATMNHSLMDLDPPKEELRSACEDELASDFLEHAKVSETTVLYRAQVAVESGLSNVKQEKKGSNKQAVADVKKMDIDISRIKPRKATEFSVKRPDDNENVTTGGVLRLDNNIIIVDTENIKLKLFDCSSSYLSSTDLKPRVSNTTWGITYVNENKFATCGLDKKIFLWKVHGQNVINEDQSYDVDHLAHGIHYNNTHYCVLHRRYNAVTILDRQGRQVRKIVKKEAFGKEIKFGNDIHIDKETNNIYVPCSATNHGVLCMSVEGECLWFTPPLNPGLFGITEIHGALCIADSGNQCLHLISKTGQCIGKLLEYEELGGTPYYIDFNEPEDKLFVSHFFSTEKRNTISVYSLL